MNRSRTCRWGLVVGAVMLTAACGDGDTTSTAVGDTTTEIDTTVDTAAAADTATAESSSPAGAITIDDADFGWALDGDGSARSGGIDVELIGRVRRNR